MQRPFADDSPHALLTRISRGEVPDPGKINGVIPRQLVAIVNKAMTCEQDRRYSTVGELCDDLDKYLNPPSLVVVTQAEYATRRLGQAFAGMLVLGVIISLLLIGPWRTTFPNPVYAWRGHYYALTETETDWESAEAEAVSHGGHLITINSAEEQAFVERTFLTPPDQIFWIGMTDADKEGDWHWGSGEPVAYTNWERAEPNNVVQRRPEIGKVLDEDYGVINWHFIVQENCQVPCTWNDVKSARDNDQLPSYRGIMELESDPR